MSNSASKFTKLTIFLDGLAKTAKLTIFNDDFAKTTKFTKSSLFVNGFAIFVLVVIFVV